MNPATERLVYEDDDDHGYVGRSNQSSKSSSFLQYATLVVAVAAVAIGSVALYQANENAKNTIANKQASDTANQLQVATTNAQSMGSNLIISHPACQGNVPSWKNCMEMTTVLNNIIQYSFNQGVTAQNVADKVAADGFKTNNHTSVVVHNSNKVVAADSLLSGSMGPSIDFLADVSMCDYSTGSACFSCVMIPNSNMCLPIAHTVLKPTDSLNDGNRNRRDSFSDSNDLFNKGISGATVVGTPTNGGSLSGKANLELGGYYAHGSTTDSNDQIGAQESAGVTAIRGSASESGHGELSKDGFGVTGSENADGSVYAGVSENAHVNAGIQGNTASFNIGGSAEGKANVDVNGNAQVGVTTPLGSDDSLIKAQGSAGATAFAGASAGAHGSIGESGISVGYHAHAGAGASANAQGSITGLDGAINIHGNVGVSVGPQVSAGGGFHATDKDGDISIGASGGLATGLGLHGGASVNINTNKIGDDIVDGVEDAGKDIVNGVESIGKSVMGDDDDTASNSQGSDNDNTGSNTNTGSYGDNTNTESYNDDGY